jgi:3-deoxy-manno-octulosonate cytidylyltransferase (CMP-KDO synthetase)
MATTGAEPRKSETRENMKALGIIPARWQATRLPGKPLAEIAGQPMIQHVYVRASQAASLAAVLVATDDERIVAAVRGFGGEAVLTSPDHRSGTDRVAEAARSRPADVVVNIQGDEPLIDPRAIDALVAPLAADPALPMSTLAVPIRAPEEIDDPGVVKVVLDRQSDALYFSRYPIPYLRDRVKAAPIIGPASAPNTEHRTPNTHLKHLGLYAYRADFLQTYARLEPTPLERAEALEQLRVLEHGHRIRVVLTDHDAVSVDTPEDLARVRAMLEARHG